MLEKKLLNGVDHGLQVVQVEGKGRGVVATKDFVIEYKGDLINITDAKELYQRDRDLGCYMYYFSHQQKDYCIDATRETGRKGRLINHSRKGNCLTKVVALAGEAEPRLVLVAGQAIPCGTELLYDYGDRCAETIRAHPWLLR